jgi:epoxyqueuosine reductase QueG
MIKEIIEEHLIPEEDYIYGFADLKGLLPVKYSQYSYGVSIGKRLDDNIIDNLLEGPTIEYFNHYKNVNRQLAELTQNIQKDLLIYNINSLPVIPTITAGLKHYEKYMTSLSYDISHKMVATRAGLGWIGKTDLLITKKFGPRLRLVTILLKQDPGCNTKPIVKSKCGKCNICVLKCPAKAATGLNWDVTIHRDEFFNAFRCREKCGELAKQRLKVDERICGLCIRVCPVGRS